MTNGLGSPSMPQGGKDTLALPANLAHSTPIRLLRNTRDPQLMAIPEIFSFGS
jgi:hypothetical protein